MSGPKKTGFGFITKALDPNKKTFAKITGDVVNPVTLSFEEYSSPSMVGGAAEADALIETKEETAYITQVLNQAKQAQIEAKKKVDKEVIDEQKQVVEKNNKEIAAKESEIKKLQEDKKKTQKTASLYKPGENPALDKLQKDIDDRISFLSKEKNALAYGNSQVALSATNNNSIIKEAKDRVKEVEKKAGIIHEGNTIYDETLGVVDIAEQAQQGDSEYVQGIYKVKNFLTRLPLKAFKFVADLGGSAYNATRNPDEYAKEKSKLSPDNRDYIDYNAYQEAKNNLTVFTKPVVTALAIEGQKQLETVDAVWKNQVEVNKKAGADIDVWYGKESIKHTFLKSKLIRTQEQLQDYLEDKGGSSIFLRDIVGKTLINGNGLEKDRVAVLESARTAWYELLYENDIVEDLDEKIKQKAASKKIKVGALTNEDFQEVFNTLDPMDQQIMLAKNFNSVALGTVNPLQSWSYRTVRDTGSSVDFIVGMWAGNKLTKGLQLIGEAGMAAKSITAAKAVKSLSNATNMSARVSSGILKTMGATSSALTTGVGITLANPKELTGERYSRYKGLKDSKGNTITVYGREGALALATKEIEEDKVAYQSTYDYLKANEESLNEEQKATLSFLSGRLGITKETRIDEQGNEVPVSTFDEELEAFKVNSKSYVMGRGVVANTIENVSELYTGKLLRSIANIKVKTGTVTAAGKPIEDVWSKVLLEKVPKVNKFIKSASGRIDNIEKWYATSRLGRKQKDFSYFFDKNLSIGDARIIGSVPEEIVEEYFASASNSLVDWDMRELKESFSTDFLSDVTSQTLLMNATFTGLGGVKSSFQRGYAGLYEKKLLNLDTKIKETAKALEADPESKDTKQALTDLQSEKKALEERASLTGFNIQSRLGGDKKGFSGVKKYLDNRLQVRKAIDNLKYAANDEELNKILDTLDLAKSDSNARVRKAMELRAKGENQAAEAVENAIDRELIVKALGTNSEKDLQGAINKVLKDKDSKLSKEQIQRLTRVASDVDDLIKFREMHENNPNKSSGAVDRATSLQHEKNLVKRAIGNIVNQRVSIKEQALEEFDTIFDSFFSGRTDKAEVMAAFVSGDMSQYEDVENKIREVGLKSAMSHLTSFDIEDHARETVASLNLAIHETLNPTKQQIEGDNLKSEFAKYYDALQNNKQDVIADLSLESMEFNEQGEIIPTAKQEQEILEKLEKKYVESGKLTKAQFNVMKMKLEHYLKGMEMMKSQMAEFSEMMATLQAQADQIEQDNVENNPENPPVSTTAPLTETTVVDADAFAEFAEGLEEAFENTTTVTQDNLLDDAVEPGAPVDDIIFSIVPESEDPKLTQFKKALQLATSTILSRTGLDTIDIMFTVKQMLKHVNPAIQAKMKNAEYLIKAWEALNLPITNVEKQQLFDLVGSPTDIGGLEAMASIFEEVVVENEESHNNKILEDNTNTNQTVTQVETTTAPVTPVATLQTLREQEEEERLKWIQESNDPVAVETRALIQAGFSAQEAFDMASRGTIEQQKVKASDQNTSYVIPFLGFNAIPYEWYSYTDQQGRKRIAKRTIEGAQLRTLKEDGYIRPDFVDLLHPDMYMSGDTFSIEVIKEEDWNKVIMQEIVNEDGSRTIFTFQDWLDTKPEGFRQTDEFMEHVPTFIVDSKGKRLAYIHDTSWYTPYSVSNPNTKDTESTETNPSVEWLDHIEAHKEGTRRLRKAIAAGLTKVTINKPLEGKWGELQPEENRISITESNPQAKLIVQRGHGNESVFNQLNNIPGFSTGEKIILNDEKDFLPSKNKFDKVTDPNGHVWALYRVGSIPHPTEKGKTIETYRLIGANRAVTDDQIETIRWAIAASKVLNGKSLKKFPLASTYDLTPAQAQERKSAIFAMTGLDISSTQGLANFINMFVKVNKSYIEGYQKTVNSKKTKGDEAKYDATSLAPLIHYLFEEEISTTELINGLNDDPGKNPVISQNTNGKILNQVSLGRTKRVVPKITIAGVEAAKDSEGNELGYEDYLKDTLSTNIKAFDMDTTGTKPVYSLIVQPKIELTYSNEDIDPNRKAASATETTVQQKAEKAAEEAAAEIETKTEPEKAPEPPKQFTAEDLSKVIADLSALGVNYETFLPTDNLFGSLDDLQSMLDLTEGLQVSQENAFLGEIEAMIISLVGFKAKLSPKTLESIKTQSRIKLNTLLNPTYAKLAQTKAAIIESQLDDVRKQAVLEAIDATLNNIDTVRNNFNELFNKALAKSTAQTKVEYKDTETDLEESELEKEKNYSKESIEESLKDKASAKMKMLMHSIPLLDSKGNPVTGYLNMNTYMSLNDMYNLILRVVSSNIDARADFNEVMDKLAKSDHPSIKIILERLEGADEQVKNQFISNITAHALSSKFVMYDMKSGKVSLKMYDTNSSEINRQIKDRWINNSTASKLYNTDGSFNTVFAQQLLNRLNAFPKDYTLVDQKVLRTWLEDVGMDFHDKTWERIYSQGIKQRNQTKSFNTLYSPGKNSLFHNLGNFLQQGIKAVEAGNEADVAISSDKNILTDLVGVSSGLSNIEADNNPELISLSYRDNGKSIFTLTPPKYITDRITELVRKDASGKPSKLVTDMLKLSYSKDSMLLNLLAQNPEMSEFLAVHHISLSAIKNKNGDSGQGEITELSELDYDHTALGGFQDRKITNFVTPVDWNGIPLRMANMLAGTMSDKSQGLFFSVPVLDLLKVSSEVFYTDRDGNIKMSNMLIDTLIDSLVRPELERIIKFHAQVKATNTKNYDQAAGLFHVIPALNTIKIGDKNLVDFLANSPGQTLNADALIDTLKVQFADRLQKVVDSEVSKKSKQWKEVGLVPNPKNDKDIQNKIFDDLYFKEAGKDAVQDFDLGVYDFVINSLLFQSESSKVFTGDIAQFSQDKNLKKAVNTASARDKKQHSIYTMSTIDYLRINKETGTNLGKRLAYLIAPGKKLNNSVDDFYNQIFLEDPIDIAENSLDLIELYHGKEARNQNETKVRDYKNYQARLFYLEETKDLTTEEIAEKGQIIKELEAIKTELKDSFPDLEGYFDIESADGQEYTTVTEHLEILDRLGRINQEQKTRILNALAAGQDIEAEDLKLIMQPIKPVHTGMYINEKTDLARVVYVKSSSFPLIPQLTRTLRLDHLRVAMERLESETGRFTRASYQSAAKVGSVNKPINPTDVLSIERIFQYKNDTDNLDSPLLILNRNNFRIQQDIPFKSFKKKQDTVALGTQIFKLLFGDGIVREDGFILNGKSVTGKELYEHYEKSFSKIIETETAKLYRELGLGKEGQIIDDKVFMMKVRDLLEKEAIDRGYPIREVRALKLSELVDVNTGGTYLDFKVPLWLSPNSNKYEALLNSLITNRVMQFKIPGNGLIAGSEHGLRKQENLEGLSVDDRNKIIYLKNWNGTELQGTKTVDGQVQKAQVMIPSKFKNSNNELIDLFEDFSETTGEGKYVKRNAQGNLTLKEDMIDPQLFNLFSFRTPTSSHVSGSSVEVVGILPPSCGDLMLVPKNFTKQKGLDFDIDKESAYGFNHYVSEDGKIKLIDEDYLNKVLSGDIRMSLSTNPEFDAQEYYDSRKLWFKDRKTDLKNIKTLRSAIRNQVAIKAEIADLKYILDQQKGLKIKDEQTIEDLTTLIDEANLELESIEEMAKDLFEKTRATEPFTKQSYLQEKERIEKEYELTFADLEDTYFIEVANQYTETLEKKIAQNEFVKCHLAVYNSPNPEVQKKINKILSMDVASSQASKIAEWKEEGVKSAFISEKVAEGMNLAEADRAYQEEFENFTMFTYSYQKSKMDLGAIGKMAIGIYAVATTFNSLVQTKFGDQGAIIDDGTPFVIGKFTSNTIGAEKSLVPKGNTGNYMQRTLSEIFAEKENTATDNEKEQILGRAGVNEMTIGVDSFMTSRGFDLDENGNSITYQLVSQPAVVEFNKVLKDSQGILGNWVEEKALIDEMVSKMSDGKITYTLSDNPRDLNYYFFDDKGNKMLGGSKLLTGNVLKKGIQSGKAEGMEQAHALMTYIQLREQSNKMIPIMSSLNTNSLGKSIPEAILKNKKLGKALFSDNSIFPQFYKLVGEISDTPGEGYYEFEVNKQSFYIKPTTPQGKIAVTGLHLGNSLFQKMFIYQEEAVQKTIDNILSIQNIDEDYATAKNYDDIVKELKKFLYSNPKLFGSFEDAALKRFDLFKDTETHDSLAKYLHDVLKNTDPAFAKAIEALKNNALVGKRLKPKIGKGENEISTIFFNNSSTDSLSDEELYTALPDLVMQNLVLPDRNGKPYTSRDLVEELVQHSFLEGGIQEATQFIKFVPVELLSSIGQINPKTNNFVSISSQLQNYNPKRVGFSRFAEILGIDTTEDKSISDFIFQYFQNNPTASQRFGYKDVKVNLQEKGNETLTITKKGASANMYPPLGHYVDINKNVYLFYHIGKGEYRSLPTNPHNRIAQYEQGKTIMTGLEGNTKAAPRVNKTLPTPNNFQYTEGMTLGEALEQIATLSVPKDREYLKVLAGLFRNNLSMDNNFKVGAIGSRGANVNGTVIIDSAYMRNPNTTNELLSETIIHETAHTLTVQELNRYYEKNATTGEYGLKPEYADGSLPLPAHVLNLNLVFNSFIKDSGLDLNLLKELKDGIQALKKASGDKSYSEEDLKKIVSDLTSKIPADQFQIYYAAVDIKEFVATLFESNQFRKFLNNIEYKQSGKSLLEKISEALIGFLDNFFPGLKDNYLAKEALMATFTFMEKERIFTFDIDNSLSLSERSTEANSTGLSEGKFGSEEKEDTETEEDDFSDVPFSIVGLSPEDWNSLSPQEQQKIKDCN